MDVQSLTRYAPLFLLVAIAVVLFVAGHMMGRSRRVAPALIGRDKARSMLPLIEAAAAACEAARRERMVIMTVAENAGGMAGPAAWFASSIASVVPVYRKGASDAFEKLERAAGVESQSLYIQKHAYKTYIRWARSMQ